jgi:hypothetical protein
MPPCPSPRALSPFPPSCRQQLTGWQHTLRSSIARLRRLGMFLAEAPASSCRGGRDDAAGALSKLPLGLGRAPPLCPLAVLPARAPQASGPGLTVPIWFS